jgi:hypothetical protein
VIRGWGLEIVGFVGIGMAVALGLAGMHGPSAETWAGVMLLTTCGILMLSVVGAIGRGPSDCPRLLGFAAFGWGYFVLARWYSFHEGPLPTVGFLPGAGDLHADLRSLPPLVRLAHDAWALAFAILGSTLTALFFKDSAAIETAVIEGAPPDRDDTAAWWRKPALGGLLGSGVIVAVSLVGRRSDAEFAAGSAFLLTLVVAGLAVLGAILARGRQRVAWLGAASFGLGYLVVAFSLLGSPELPTNHFLNAVFRPDGPTTANEPLDDDLTTDEESRRVWKALDEPISFHFREGTSLQIILERIKDAIRGPSGESLRAYATDERYPLHRTDLEALRVSIDRDKIPAKEALRLCLSQVGLAYRIQSGYVRIYRDAYQPPPFAEDPVMIAGHSLLAMIAAAIGGVAAPIIAGFCGRHGQDGGRDTA